MKQRERLLKLLRGESAPLAWYADLSWIYGAGCEWNTIDEVYREEKGYLQYHRDFGAGICFYAPQLWKREFDEAVQVITQTKGNEKITEWQTPRGNICQK